MNQPLNTLVKAAQDGDPVALEQVIRAVKDKVHGLAIRMLFNPDDARDATQEILIKIVTKLSTFRGESSFDTWVYRVSTNSLLTTRKVIQNERGLTFHLYQQDLQSGLVIDPSPPAEDVVRLNECGCHAPWRWGGCRTLLSILARIHPIMPLPVAKPRRLLPT